jgi:eukaryotic-like serine/threonine-protein kinase
MSVTVSRVPVVGRYRIEHELGSGGMGRVWLAHDDVLDRDVAVKEVTLPLGLDDAEREELLQRTMREARTAARLTHPNVVRVYDVVRTGEQPWIVMEYVRSRSLLQVIREDGPLAVPRVAEIGLALLAALGASHRAGVLHRDVKPSNVLMADDGKIVLTDFGLATFDEGDNAASRPGLIFGSPHYVAPERARYGVSTPKSDLWSLGATLYSAVEGRSPYARSTTLATLTALATEPPDPTRRAGALRPVLDGLLRKDPATRMGVAEAEQLLRRVAAGEFPVSAASSVSSVSSASAGSSASSGSSADGTASTVNLAADPGTRSVAPRSGGSVLPRPTGSLLRPTGSRLRPTGSRARRWIAVSAAVGAVAAAGGGAALLTGGGHPSRAAVHRPVADVISPLGIARLAVPAAAPAADPVSRLVPDGWGWYQDPVGYRVAVPTGWPVVMEGRTAYFCDPHGSRMLEVGPWDPAGADLTTALAREEAEEKLAGYHRIRLEAGSAPGTADWEYLYTDSKRGKMHGLTRGFVAAGRAYLIEWRTPVAEWPSNVAGVDILTASFTPSRPGRLQAY